MNGKLRRISLADMGRLMEYHLDLTQAEGDAIFEAGRLSQPIYAGMFNQDLLCFVGIIPPTLMSDNAYIWCYVTLEVAKHRISFARYARRFIAELRKTYPVIYGHCFDDNSYHWLKSLGAIRTSATTFEIVSWPHH